MSITVEVFGVVRDLLGGAAEQIEMREPVTARQALAMVAARHPALVGPVLEADGCTPTPYFLVNLDGRRFLDDLEERLPDGSHLLLLTALTGGGATAGAGVTPPQTIAGGKVVVEIDDPHGLVTRWQRYGRDRLFLEGLKGVYIGLDDGTAPEFSNPAYPWGCERIAERGRLIGYRYWYRQAGTTTASVRVRFTDVRSRPAPPAANERSQP